MLRRRSVYPPETPPDPDDNRASPDDIAHEMRDVGESQSADRRPSPRSGPGDEPFGREAGDEREAQHPTRPERRQGASRYR